MQDQCFSPKNTNMGSKVIKKSLNTLQTPTKNQNNESDGELKAPNSRNSSI